MRQNLRRGLGLALCLTALWGLGFAALWRWDNKYAAALPARPGVNTLAAGDGLGFLVDGWEYYPGELLGPEDFAAGRTPGEYVYAGRYPNFSAALGVPYGEATYRLTLQNDGDPASLSIFLPEIPSASRVYIGGAPAGETGSVKPYRPLVRDTVYSFTAGEQTELILQTANYSHYYGGLYYPPAVGSPQAVASMAASRMAVYGLLCFFAAAVALSNLALWACGRARRDRVTLLFGLLCASFSLRVCYPFLRMAGAPAVRALYALEDAAGGAVVLCAVCLTALLSGRSKTALYRRAVLPACAFFAAAGVLFPLFILPYAPALINGYGLAISIWKGLAALWMLGAALRGLVRARPPGRFLLAGAALFGASLLASVAAINRFEPARGAWPEEYGGFALVFCFAALMVRRGREMAEENLRLNARLREEVERKTASLTAVLTERKQLLAQLVHDIKTPMASMRGYADLIRAQDVGVDPETRGYLDAIRDRMDALDDRFRDLREFTAGERQPDLREPLCLNDLLAEFHRRNLPDMELGGQDFLLRLPGERLSVFGSRGQLWRALENLCYNALSFTPEDGRVTLSLARDGDAAVVKVADTGAGVSPEDLPHIFERGYSRRADGSGSGLGLFITRSIVLEHGGEISATSESGRGAAFTIRLPLCG